MISDLTSSNLSQMEARSPEIQYSENIIYNDAQPSDVSEFVCFHRTEYIHTHMQFFFWLFLT